ncbi:unnamed protein product [Clavelina lepadiformis]|uniref:Uncharacterized protein n=1 Tax=Clavelina lepadiformis TaxID=159417 RepID=A0ABP0G070_CLALP
MENPTECYGNMLEKYRDLDEDEILSNLTQEELAQLDGEIDREVLNQIPEEKIEDDTYYYTSTSDEDASDEEEEGAAIRRAKFLSQKRKSFNKSIDRQSSLEDKQKHSSKSPHRFRVPPLRKASSREGLRRQKSEEGGEMKKELMQAVKRRTKRRTSRANSSGISRRYNKRRNSSNLLKRQNSKVPKEDRKNAPTVNTNFITQEMLTLRPKLKKVQTREPAKPQDMLHGISLGHVTSGAKKKDTDDDQTKEQSLSREEEDDDEPDNYDDTDGSVPTADDAVAEANDDVHRRVQSQRTKKATQHNYCPSDDVASSTTAGSTSAESYDVVGELSINSNSVEDTILRVWKDDENLTEVNLNNIQNVGMEVFEELASAMECNTHVRHLLLANVGLTDRPARALASMLRKNMTLQMLNVESNFITGDAALRLVAALRRNTSLTELRIDNQRHIFGAKVEHEFSKILRDNRTLLKFGYQFANPGPRMASSNCLTRNVDDVRKKRVAEQRTRMQASRPQLRRQTSSEWHRKERAEKIKKLSEQGIPLDLFGAVKDEHVENLLEQMDPRQVALLEQWFIQKLLGNPDRESGPAENTERVKKTSIKNKQAKVPTPRKFESPRDKVLESIRNQSPRLPTPAKMEPCTRDSPGVTSGLSDVDLGSSSPSIVVENVFSRPGSPTPPKHTDNEKLSASDVSLNPTSSASSSDDIIEWQEGDEYDSDEYEVVEIDVTESDDDVSYEKDSDVSSKLDENIDFRQMPMIPEHLSPDAHKSSVSSASLSSISSRDVIDEESVTSEESNGSDLSKRHAKDEAIKGLDRLQISCKYETPTHFGQSKSTDNSPASRRNGKKLSAPVSPASSRSSGSPISTTPRPVKDDESWIFSRPHYRLGEK